MSATNDSDLGRLLREYEEAFSVREEAQAALSAADEALTQACYRFEGADAALGKRFEALKAGARLRAKGEMP